MVKQMIKHQAYLDTGYHAKGRIKRMRFNKNLKGIGFFIYKYEKLRYNDVKIQRFPITRWNRH